jgi:hypothetical protein
MSDGQWQLFKSLSFESLADLNFSDEEIVTDALLQISHNGQLMAECSNSFRDMEGTNCSKSLKLSKGKFDMSIKHALACSKLSMITDTIPVTFLQAPASSSPMALFVAFAHQIV